MIKTQSDTTVKNMLDKVLKSTHCQHTGLSFYQYNVEGMLRKYAPKVSESIDRMQNMSSNKLCQSSVKMRSNKRPATYLVMNH